MSDDRNKEILKIEHLDVMFTQYERGFRRRILHPVADLNLSIHAGEIVAVVGSSGSGKSLLAHAVLGILPYNAGTNGTIYYDGAELTEERIKRLRGNEIVLVPQSVSYLDPLMKIGNQVTKGRKSPQVREHCREVLSGYGLGPEVEKKYPFQLSGGMTRRVLIATAVMEQPRLVIADEPTPGLHMEVAKRVMGHFREIAGNGAGVLLITHDLELAIETADRVAVLYAGTLIEEAAAGDFRDGTVKHPYSQGLVRALPDHWNTENVKSDGISQNRFCDTGELMREMKKEYRV